jgi:hypothetical protein
MEVELQKVYDCHCIFRAYRNTISAGYAKRHFLYHAGFFMHNFDDVRGTRFDAVTTAVAGILIDEHDTKSGIFTDAGKTFNFSSLFKRYTFRHIFTSQ